MKPFNLLSLLLGEKPHTFLAILANIMLLISFTYCKRIEKKTLSEEDWIAPFGLGTIPWDSNIRASTSIPRFEFEKEYLVEGIFADRKIRVFVPSPKRVSSVVLGDIEYLIPPKWEGYILRIDSPVYFTVSYCILGDACETATLINKAPKSSEFFFAVTAGTKPVLFVFTYHGGDIFCPGCGYLFPRFYLCFQGIDSPVCEADELSYRNPNSVKISTDTAADLNAGARIYVGNLTVEVVSLNQVTFGVQKTVVEDLNENEIISTSSFFSDLLYELLLSLTGETHFQRSKCCDFPAIRIYGCGVTANEMRCWWGHEEISILSSTRPPERKIVKDLRVRFFIPASAELKKIVVQELYPSQPSPP